MLLKDFISGAVSALENLYAQNEAKAIVFRYVKMSLEQRIIHI